MGYDRLGSGRQAAHGGRCMADHQNSAIDRWAKSISSMNKLAFWVTYVATFAVMFATFFFGLICHGKGFIWGTDGLEQQYMFFIQEGQWLRELIGNIGAGTFEIPMWSQQVGYGADYIYSADITLTNPINLLSVFAYPENADLILQLTIPITLFLAGLTFLWYCSYKRFDSATSLVGCFVYLFGGFSFIAYSQIYMLYVLVLVPLIVRGVDRLFDGLSPCAFIVAMALTYSLGVSTGYMTSLLLFIYCLVKYFFLPESKSVLGFLRWFFKIFGCLCLSFLIAGIMFFPVAMNIVSQGRLGLEREQGFLYELSYYAALLRGFLTKSDVGADCMIGFAPVAALCIGLLFATKTKSGTPDRMIKILFVVYTLILLLPLAGRVTNGFAYPNNRWVFGYAFLVAVMTVVMLPKLQVCEDRERNKALVIIGVYTLLCLAAAVMSEGKFGVYLGFAVLVLTLVVWAVFARKRDAFKLWMLATVVVSCLSVSYPLGLALSDEHVDFGRAYEVAAEGNPAKLVAGIDSSTPSTRYDTGNGIWAFRNGNWALGLSGATFYNSYYNGFIDEYHTSLGLATSSMNFAYCTYNARTAMEALGGTEYFVAEKGNPVLVPPTFSKEAVSGEVAGRQYVAYSADSVVPLAYVQNNTLRRSEYDALGLVERQDAMLQALVLEGEGTVDGGVRSRSKRLPYKIELEAPEGSTLDVSNQFPNVDDSKVYLDGSPHGTVASSVKETLSPEEKARSIKISDNEIQTTLPSTVLYFDVDIPENSEAYFCITDLDFESVSNNGTGDDSSFQRFKAAVKSLFAPAPRETFLYVHGDGTRQEIWQTNGRHHLYGGKNDWAVNVGYADYPRKTIAVEFRVPGVYRFSSMDIVAEDSAAIAEDIDAITDKGADNIRFLGNTMSCNVAGAKSGDYLATRIPYDIGWSAKVNGAQVEIERSNIGFMALRLPEGASEVVLSYEMPYLRIGAVLSLVGLVLTVAVLGFLRFRRGRQASPARAPVEDSDDMRE